MATRAKKRTGLFLNVLTAIGRMGYYVKEQTENSEVYTDKNGKTKNYEFFEDISGKAAKCYIFEKEFGTGGTTEMLVINLVNNEGNIESVSVPFNTGYAQAFIKRLPNIDANKELVIKCYRIKDAEKSKEKGKDVVNEMLLPYQVQDGKLKSVENFFKAIMVDGENQNPNKLPEADKKVVKEKGKNVTKYDFTEQKEFMRELVKSFNEKLKETEQFKVSSAPVDEVIGGHDNDENFADDDNDDMPF